MVEHNNKGFIPVFLIMLGGMKSGLAESGGPMPAEVHRDHLAYPY